MHDIHDDIASELLPDGDASMLRIFRTAVLVVLA